MKENAELLKRLRRELELPFYVSDGDLLKQLEGTFFRQRIELSIAFEKLLTEICKALGVKR